MLCSPWVTDLTCEGVVDQTALTDAALVASEVLYALSGRQWPGICEETVRPCSTSRGPHDTVQHLAGSNTWVSYGGCGCGQWDDCACGGVSLLQLRRDALDVLEVTEGEFLITDWALQDNGRLLRVPPGVWPCCQDLTAPVGSPGSFAVTYTYGAEPPASAVAAATEFACQLARATVGLPCDLPERVTSVSRQGVSFAILDPQDFLVTGRTGIYSVDLFLQSVNPKRLARRGSVWAPRRTRLTRDLPTGS
jgi:hypothetical protein